jgi:SH3-like domain-containing protein
MTANSVWAQLERTGLPVPRFVSLKASEANLRAGPGTRYPVQWVYRRIGLPLEITAEFYNWRQVRDPDGTEGWMHGSMLSGTRTLIISQPVAVLYETPSVESNPIARLESGVIAEVDECVAESGWCRVQVGTANGWISASNSWGVTARD